MAKPLTTMSWQKVSSGGAGYFWICSTSTSSFAGVQLKNPYEQVYFEFLKNYQKALVYLPRNWGSTQNCEVYPAF